MAKLQKHEPDELYINCLCQTGVGKISEEEQHPRESRWASLLPQLFLPASYAKYTFHSLLLLEYIQLSSSGVPSTCSEYIEHHISFCCQNSLCLASLLHLASSKSHSLLLDSSAIDVFPELLWQEHLFHFFVMWMFSSLVFQRGQQGYCRLCKQKSWRQCTG